MSIASEILHFGKDDVSWVRDSMTLLSAILNVDACIENESQHDVLHLLCTNRDASSAEHARRHHEDRRTAHLDTKGLMSIDLSNNSVDSGGAFLLFEGLKFCKSLTSIDHRQFRRRVRMIG